jgi:hypothetical protein
MDFIATKRVGAVLAAPNPLTWHQAQLVLDRLNAGIGNDIDKIIRAEVSSFFETKAETIRGKAANADAIPDRSRGHVYHSKRVVIFAGGFKLHFAISFTICVLIDVPFLDQPARTSQSKYWCSVIISDDEPPVTKDRERRFAEVCAQIEKFAPLILDKVKPHYVKAVNQVSDVGEVRETGDRFSTLVFQVEDTDFRGQLDQLESGAKKLTEVPRRSALGLLDRLYSGPNWHDYLHEGRDQDELDVTVDAILRRNGVRQRGFLIETRRNNSLNKADWRMLGVTSSSEPVIWAAGGDPSEVEQLVHSPANVMSAEVAAEIGEQF